MTDPLPDTVGPSTLRQLNQAFPERYPFLLQSTANGNKLGRYDILFADVGEALVLEGDGSLCGPGAEPPGDFLPALDRWWHQERVAGNDSEFPFGGGWFLYLGYELAAEVEPSLTLHRDPLLPTAFAVRCKSAAIYDHETHTAHFVAEGRRTHSKRQFDDDLAGLIRQPQNAAPRINEISEEEPERFLAAVRAAKMYIEAGDIYQANLSRQWDVSLLGMACPESVYDALCEANPAPFAGIARWLDTAVISSSPERLLEVRDGWISTRPIAGTRRRGDSERSDATLSDELIAHPKERAEHVMLIDLERNDLGRVCEPGTVTVDEMMVLESYAHVHHIVSNVRGKLRQGITPGDSIAAVFPGGTITGCPKVRCMEIIDEQESAPRGAYTGSFGYLNRDGSLDLNILIRTMVKQRNQLSLRAGAGIVADSDPVSELDETRAKAKGMLRALGHG